MKERTKKILLWSSIILIIGAAAAATATMVTLQQKRKKERNELNKNNYRLENKNQKDKKVDFDILNKKKNEEESKPIIEHIDDEDPKEINELETKEKKIISWEEVFPRIKKEDYYEKLNFSNGQAIIDEDMILYIIKDILNRMLITDGIVEYAYKKLDDQNFIISFKWNNEKQKSVVSYKISTNKL
ncbi:MHO_1590 family protein [Metamycoplasma auris]|uniref:Uncharacterized protein n=1 Tax=Metamycoplasma auris TaxID=51363 RepID=A0A2W7I1W4_9BACT|nr:hypothetical protein [Metamycoplasma auris]PZW01426.1 hypothetical protein BCF89_10248 [Metamycoplasma auris]